MILFGTLLIFGLLDPHPIATKARREAIRTGSSWSRDNPHCLSLGRKAHLYVGSAIASWHTVRGLRNLLYSSPICKSVSDEVKSFFTHDPKSQTIRPNMRLEAKSPGTAGTAHARIPAPAT